MQSTARVLLDLIVLLVLALLLVMTFVTFALARSAGEFAITFQLAISAWQTGNSYPRAFLLSCPGFWLDIWTVLAHVPVKHICSLETLPSHHSS